MKVGLFGQRLDPVFLTAVELTQPGNDLPYVGSSGQTGSPVVCPAAIDDAGVQGVAATLLAGGCHLYPVSPTR